MVRRNINTLMHEIEDQIRQRRSTLRGIADRDAQNAINAVLAEWSQYQETIDHVQRGLETDDVNTVIVRINEIGRKVFANSWQDLE